MTSVHTLLVRIQADEADTAPTPGSAVETAVIRMIARLPADWTATLSAVAGRTATVALTVRDDLPPGAVLRTLDHIMARRELSGWCLARSWWCEVSQRSRTPR